MTSQQDGDDELMGRWCWLCLYSILYRTDRLRLVSDTPEGEGAEQGACEV